MIRLINGDFGIGFLDAIINSPFDADKIDYVFRDADVTNVFIPQIKPKQFIDRIKEGVSISPEGLLVFKESSADAVFKVLTQREKLYEEFYLKPALRLLEKAVKFIIITYYVHTYNRLPTDIPKNIEEKFLDDKIQISDLGAVRIAMAADELEERSGEYRGGQMDTEGEIVRYMSEKMKNKLLDKKIKDALNDCFLIITNTNSEQDCKREERKRTLDQSIQSFPKNQIDKIRHIAKTVSLRYPGVILIDVLPPFNFFKTTRLRRQKTRSDGTSASSECILIKSQIEKLKQKRESERRAPIQVNIFKLGRDSEVSKALDLFEKLSEEERPIGVEE